MKNYGLKRNCSVSIIYPERIQLLSVDVGVTGHFRQQEEEIGIRSKVKNKTKTDGIAYSDSRTLRTYIRTMAFELLISKDMYTNIFFLFLQCNHFIGAYDFVEIAGGNGFELGFLNVRARYCGMEANVGKKPPPLLENIMMMSYLYL